MHFSRSQPGLVLNERESAIEAHNALLTTHGVPQLQHNTNSKHNNYKNNNNNSNNYSGSSKQSGGSSKCPKQSKKIRNRDRDRYAIYKELLEKCYK